MRDAKHIIADLGARDLLELAVRCSEAHGVTVEDLCSRDGRGGMAASGARSARYAFWMELVDKHAFSFPRAAALFGVDHSTVLYGVRRSRGLSGKARGRSEQG